MIYAIDLRRQTVRNLLLAKADKRFAINQANPHRRECAHTEKHYKYTRMTYLHTRDCRAGAVNHQFGRK